ncbi:YjbF family lipoprotein [Aestuariicoccus sp. MJ-SS9]|uniref:YjbF family lipoprotein n=1 Tax=Aestuariicoccus sp. MJ-SS9 TaxID=3079855 RepID=UPI00290DA7EA|nr:YjbF family lipoprotein [Aestuariicoccus sp. MJ-SS9]MDU8914010.1 YjbF family lipoprotein [Aestuariicoccus sp. MJ-SS9]
MGAVLEMMRALILALALSACSAPQAPDPRKVLSRAQLDQLDTPLLLAEIDRLDTVATLIPRGENRGMITWQTGGQVALMFRDGVLVGTRGLGDDLMSADVSNTRAMLAGQAIPEFYPRFHSGLDGTFQTTFRTFQCQRIAAEPETITIFGRPHATTRTDERCVSPGLDVTNSYWRDGSGLMWKSRQWISKNVGYVLTERLVR